MNEGKAKNVIEYLDNLIDKGRATPGAVKPLKTAFEKVMSAVDKGDWKTVEVKDIDVDDYIQRFSVLTAGHYSTQSISVYKSRVNRVLTWYKKFLEVPGWMPDVAKRNTSGVKRGSAQRSPQSNVQHEELTADRRDAGVADVGTPQGQISYSYPLMSGELIRISLPVKLTKKDAERIASFVASIAIEEVPRLQDTNPQH